MLALTTRLVCGAALVCLLGCDSETSGKPITGSKTHADDADGGEDHSHSDVITDHQVAVGGAGKSGSTTSNAMDDAGMDDHATRKPATNTPPAPKAGTGGKAGAAGKSGAGGEPSRAGEGGAGGEGDADEGAAGSGGDGDEPEAGKGAAGSGAPRDPRDVLWDLAKRTPQGMTADIIRRYLDELGSGDTPASSVEEFLHSIDDEAHCTQMISQECLAACSVVTRTCAVCVLDEDCRSELTRVCGVAALACGR